MSEELKPCPFCGGEAEFERKGDRRQSTIVSCTCCGATQECGEEWGHGKTWNTRHIPEGYALVPVEPTRAMREAFHDSYEDYENGHASCPDAQWKAMIAAAQAKPE